MSTPWRHAVERDVDRVGVAAEVVAGLEQRDARSRPQRMRDRQAAMPEPMTAMRRINSGPRRGSAGMQEEGLDGHG